MQLSSAFVNVELTGIVNVEFASCDGGGSIGGTELSLAGVE